MPLEIKCLDRVFLRFENDERINAWHVSVYMSLFYLWSLNGSKNPVLITRRQVMKLAKIRSMMTYHKCMRQLVEYGYVMYEPSYHPKKGSVVTLLIFDG